MKRRSQGVRPGDLGLPKSRPFHRVSDAPVAARLRRARGLLTSGRGFMLAFTSERVEELAFPKLQVSEVVQAKAEFEFTASETHMKRW
jgi:hypothetical protein